MRRPLAWLVGAAGGVAAYRLLRRRRGDRAVLSPEPAAGLDPRAEELRARLDAARQEPAAEPLPPEAAPAPEPGSSPEERRRRVHEQGRAALDEMHEGG